MTVRILSRLIAALFAASLILPAALTVPVMAAAADHLAFSALPANPASGADTVITVQARDSLNAIDTGYTGTVTLTTGNGSDVVTLSPHAYVVGDAGTFNFHVTFGLAGSRTLTATDSVITDASGGLTVVAGTPDHLTFATQPTGASAAVNLGTQPVVNVRDAAGNLVTTSSAAVTLALTTAGGASLACTTNPVTASGGVATFAGCSVNKAGTYTLTATAAGPLTGTSDPFTITAGVVAVHLGFTAGDPSVFGGTPFAIQPKVQVQDAGIDPIADAGVVVTIAINTNPVGGTLSGTLTATTDVNGLATFSGLSLDKAGTGYRLIASAPGLAADRTGPIDVAVGPAHQLAYAQGPTGSVQGVAISPSVTVQVQDAGGNLVSTDTSAVHVAIGTNPSAGTLSGTATQSAVAGVATFNDLSIDLAGVGYTLVATDGGLTQATSAPFTITLAPNHAPAGADKTITTNEDTPYTFATSDFGFSDVSDAPPNTLLAVKITTLPAAGALLDNGLAVVGGASIPVADITGNKLTFVPAANANGAGYASFTFQVQDNGGTANGGVDLDPTPNTITVNVTAVDDAPVATADANVVKQGTTLTTTALTGVLANDTDVDTLHSALTAVLNVGPTHGSLTLNADGSYVYTPTPSYVGADSFTYHAFDGTLASNIVTVALTVYVNHPPVAVADVKTVVSGSPATTLNVLANDNAANPDTGETLTVIAVGAAAHGTVAIPAGGAAVTYRPKSTFVGTDTFTYTVSDGQFSTSGTVTVHVIKDSFKPTTTAPVQTLPSQAIGSKTVVVHLAWTGTDIGSGVARYQLQQSTNGGAYQPVTLAKNLSVAKNRTLTVGSTYRFRVRAIDKRGNTGAWTYGPKFRVVRYQETAATYTGAWANRTGASFSGGHERSTSATGAAATFTSTGRTFSWVAIRAASRGTAQVFVDGVLAKSVALSAASTTFRSIVFSTTFASSGTHTIRIVFTGSAPKFGDVDAFVVLR
ncbi:MAG TPA: Ig-like domain-containing protein [Candidatus Acidoferrum sp.]|nr:Ig-like domain-containing protein [Candidatus Acidoferrum sp.]